MAPKKMYSCVILEKSKTVLVVQSKWCYALRKLNAVILNHGIPPHKGTKIFYSPLATATVCFQQRNCEGPFDGSKTACYRGFILKSGTRKKMRKFAKTRRHVLPTNYRLNKEKKKKGDCELARLNRQLIIKEEQLESVQKSVFLISKHLDIIDLEEMEALISSDESDGSAEADELDNAQPENTGNEAQMVDPKFSIRYGYTMVNGNNRAYIHGGITLNGGVVSTLKEWNRDKGTQSIYDTKFIRMLLLNVFTVKVLERSVLGEGPIGYDSLDPEKLRFVRDLFNQRININKGECDTLRSAAFDYIVNQYCHELRRKNK